MKLTHCGADSIHYNEKFKINYLIAHNSEGFPTLAIISKDRERSGANLEQLLNFWELFSSHNLI